MIEFKIITSPDKSQQAIYQHLGTELILGRDEGDMIIDDPALGPKQLRIKVKSDSATIENLNPSVEVRLNGKAISGESPLKEKDNLTMARTTINFSRIDTAPLVPPEPFENSLSKNRVVEGSKEKAILDVLGQLESQAKDIAIPAPPIPGGKPPPPLPKR